MHTRSIRWTLFVAFALTVPVLWFVLFGGGLIPLIAILLGLLSTLSWLKLDVVPIVIMDGINLILWGAVLFFVAGLCARAIERAPQSWRPAIIGIVLLALVGLTFLPIYTVGDAGGGGTGGMVNLYRLLSNSHALF
jgi:hypothetical protein